MSLTLLSGAASPRRTGSPIELLRKVRLVPSNTTTPARGMLFRFPYQAGANELFSTGNPEQRRRGCEVHRVYERLLIALFQK